MTGEKGNNTVYVAGGASGIGAGIVTSLAQAGFDVCFSYRSSKNKVDALTEELESRYPEQSISSFECDLSDRNAVTTFAERLSEADDLYGLIYNAGTSYDTLAALVDQDKAAATFQVNFWAMTQLIAAATRPMMRARQGRIVGIGSLSAKLPTAGNAVYAASKGAMFSYIKAVALELGRRGITANFISPGYIDTDLLAPYAESRDFIESKIPLRRYGQTDEIGALAAFLLSEKAGYITGSDIPIDGGLTAGLTIQS